MTPYQSAQDLAKLIDHTALKPNTTHEDIKRLCAEAKTHGFYSVCVNPIFIPLCVQELAESSVLPITVVGFPLGSMTSQTKAFETEVAIRDGALEIDMVLQIPALLDGDYKTVSSDIKAVVQAAQNSPVKVILETCLLTPEQIKVACELSVEAGAQFVKTSTGFSTNGASEQDIKLMRSVVGTAFGVKASGGIRDLGTALKMIQAGANRLGCSASVAIINEFKNQTQESLLS